MKLFMRFTTKAKENKIVKILKNYEHVLDITDKGALITLTDDSKADKLMREINKVEAGLCEEF